MQAWGSLLGVGVSTLAVIITGLLLRHEMHARREEKEDVDAAQARLVATGLRNPEYGGDGHVETVQLALRNYSNAPIYELYMELRDSRGEGRRAFAGKVLRAGSAVMYQRYVPPNGEAEARYAFFVNTRVMQIDLLMFGEVYIRFIDASGLAWSKKGTNAPVRLRGEQQPTLDRESFWRLLWQYLWPIPALARFGRRYRYAVRKRVQATRDAVIRHMRRSIDRRLERQMVEAVEQASEDVRKQRASPPQP